MVDLEESVRLVVITVGKVYEVRENGPLGKELPQEGVITFAIANLLCQVERVDPAMNPPEALEIEEVVKRGGAAPIRANYENLSPWVPVLRKSVKYEMMPVNRFYVIPWLANMLSF
jgi:hypothetical protein